MAAQPQTFGAGPWHGVLDTPEPFDDTPDKLQDLLNGYFVDPKNGCGVSGRPGFLKAAPNITTGGKGSASAIWTHTALDGTVYRFAAVNAKLYRLSGTNFVTATDVTPVGVAIDNSITPTARFYMRSFANVLIFSDGVHRPWIGTNLGSTPITGTYIDIDSAGTTWTTAAAPTEYFGSLFFIVTTYAGGAAVQAGVGMVWCEPNQPSLGYCQTNYADFWNLIQQTGGQIGSLALKALAATNNSLYYFREYSIGAVQGIPSLSFSSTATRDLVSQNVGTNAPGSIAQFGQNVFFVDTIGRPFMFTEGGRVQPLWEQMRGQISATPSLLSNPNATALVAVSCVVPQLNVVVMSGWSSNAAGTGGSGPLGVGTLYVFAQDTGAYLGRWTGASTLATFDALAVMKDATNNPTLTAFSQDTGLGATLWLQGLLSSTTWQDNSTTIPITAYSQRMGYSMSVAQTLQKVRVLAGVATQIGLSTVSSNNTVNQGNQTPPTSNDTTFLAQWLPDMTVGRGFQLQVTPQTTTTQWQLYRIEADMTSAEVVAGDP